jgi:hypothetical protein
VDGAREQRRSIGKGFSRIDIDTNESDPSYSLAGQLMGLPLKSLQGFGVPTGAGFHGCFPSISCAAGSSR